ncbi:MAG TPA: polyketide synthase [Pseudonocardiaceae bacterium]|nr:polyketide synthase [Pseudonocardiaceae bacterium]
MNRFDGDQLIAVVGMSCRLPGAENLGLFWDLLRDGVEGVAAVPDGRHYPAIDGLPRRGGYLRAVDRFDARLFAISPREARDMDPQQRLILELGWEALEDARISLDSLRGHDMGVFVGVTSDDYAVLQHRSGRSVGHHWLTGANRSIIANRLSHLLGLSGPSISVDTGQSSGLVAVHLACASIRAGECESALVGGVQLNLAAESTQAIVELGALSPDGRCFVFDARANGMVRGEGGGVVVLKPLSQALVDGDHVYCVIRGSAVNNDATADGLTTPGTQAQENVLTAACRRAGVTPAAVQYVELHGTGTRVGDPIEAAALGAVYGDRPTETPLWIGSVKTNVGHLEAAAGIVGLIKTALAVDRRVLPPSLNFERPNPQIRFQDWQLRVVQETMPWPAAHRTSSPACRRSGWAAPTHT